MPSLETVATEVPFTTTTLVRYVEVWLPNADGTRLRLAHAQFCGAKWVEDSKTRVTAVAIGQGLAGKAWEHKSGTIKRQDSSGQLSELSTRCGEDLDAALAIPVFCKREIRGVAILGFGTAPGAAEIWARDDRDELAVSAAHYSGLPSFEFISRYTRFPKGAGLPGGIWQKDAPILLNNPARSDSFIRSFGNDPADIGAAVGIPIGHEGGFPASVLLLLSATTAPLAATTEIWTCEQIATDDESPAVQLVTVTSEATGTVTFDTQTRPESWQSSVLRETQALGGPVIVSANDAELPTEAKFNVAIPFFNNRGLLKSVLNLMY